MDGLEATRAIRALGGEWSRIPIVALTANAFPEDVRMCREAGMNDFVAKPIRKKVSATSRAGAATKLRQTAREGRRRRAAQRPHTDRRGVDDYWLDRIAINNVRPSTLEGPPARRPGLGKT